jgi:hypothetical protein
MFLPDVGPLDWEPLPPLPPFAADSGKPFTGIRHRDGVLQRCPRKARLARRSPKTKPRKPPLKRNAES